MYPWKTSLAIATFAAVVLLPPVVPSLKNYFQWDPRNIASIWDLPVPPPKVDVTSEVTIEDLRVAKKAAGPHLLDPQFELDHFYAALLRPGKIVRVLHYGDSPTTADLVTGDVRAMLQTQFGDAGTGFALIARPWAWYNHRGLEMDASGWKIDVAGAGEIRDGLFGIGGATFRGGEGTAAHWRLRNGGHRYAEVAYLAQPGGGTFAFEADDMEIGTADTSAETIGPAFASFELPAGTTRYTLRVTGGQVRLHGVEFRKASGGVLYSSLGINGAGVTTLSRNINYSHWTAVARHYQPDLVVIAYGTNESGYPKYVDSTWGTELRAALKRIRAALPNASILLMSPMDRADRNEQGVIATTPALARLVEIERQVAEETGTAFFNTFKAMGGEGTMAKWYAAEPRLVGADFIHPLPAGGKIVGELLFRALHDGFQDYKLRQLNIKDKLGDAAEPGPSRETETSEGKSAETKQ